MFSDSQNFKICSIVTCHPHLILRPCFSNLLCQGLSGTGQPLHKGSWFLMPQIIGSFYLDLSCIFALHDPHDGIRVKNTHCFMFHIKHHANQIWFNCVHVCFFCSGLFANACFFPSKNCIWNETEEPTLMFIFSVFIYLVNLVCCFLWRSQLSVASLLQMPQLASQPKLHLALRLCSQWKWNTEQETKREKILEITGHPDFTVQPTSASVCTCQTKPTKQTNNHTRSNFWKACQLSNTPLWNIPKHQSSNCLPRFQTTFEFWKNKNIHHKEGTKNRYVLEYVLPSNKYLISKILYNKYP